MATEMASSSSNQAVRKDISLPGVLPPGYTMAVTIRSTWAILMARHTGSRKILFGETRLGRNIPAVKGVEAMRGPTIATVPVLLDIDREQTVASVLDSVRETGIKVEAFEHVGLQNISRVSEDGRAACGFQTLLVVQKSEGHEGVAEGEELILELDDTIDDLRNFNSYHMTIVFNQTSRGLVVDAVFRESVISTDLVEHLLLQFESILEGLCNAPAGPQSGSLTWQRGPT